MKQIMLLAIFCFSSLAFGLEEEYRPMVENLVKVFKSGDVKQMAEFVSYPLGRDNPIPSIKSKQEMIKRFDEVFDQHLLDLIANSNIGKDWESVGWRGIMLANGKVWMDLDGKIHAISYQSEVEKKIKDDLIRAQKSGLHESVRDYSEPVLEWKTKKFHIRIDDMGDANYRYVTWPIKKNQSEKPSLILLNGEYAPDGSGGNHYYIFKNGEYEYKCYVSVLGTDETPPGALEVYKKDELILDEEVLEVVGY
jgi:hypothetical protein